MEEPQYNKSSMFNRLNKMIDKMIKLTRIGMMLPHAYHRGGYPLAKALSNEVS
jgi:hypothetical protein